MNAATPVSVAQPRPLTLRRVIVGVGLAVAGVGSVFEPIAFYVVILAIGLSSLYELSRLCDRKGQPLEYQVAFIGVLGYIVLSVFEQLSKWEGALLAFIVLAAFWLGMYGEQKGYFARTAYTLLAVLYIGKLLTYFIFIRQMPPVDGHDAGLSWTLFVIVLIALTDTLAMVVGSVFGRTRLTKISPKKTVEGSGAALLLVTAIGAFLATTPFVGMQWWQGAALAAATSLAAQAGDLVESALKRDAGVKDTGTVIQGHGGVLDRFDSYLFGGMAFYGMLHLVGLLPFG